MIDIKAGREYFFSSETELTGQDETVTVNKFTIDISAKSSEDLQKIYENGIVRFYFGFPLPWFEFALFKHGFLPKNRTDIQIVISLNKLSSVYEKYRDEYITIAPKECFGFTVLSKESISISHPVEIKVTMNGYCGMKNNYMDYVMTVLTEIAGE